VTASAPLELLYEATGLPSFPLPETLAARYGGTLGFGSRRLVTNFVSSLDGVVAIPAETNSPRLIGGATEADRFVMALLRACAGALVMGASTFRASSEARWTAASLYPQEAAAFAQLRERLGLDAEPQLAVVTRSGALDPAHPALEVGALVFTTESGARRLRSSLPAASEAVVAEREGAVDLAAVIEVLRERGHDVVLSEGGPTIHGALLAAGLVDELFLTVSPLLAGRPGGEERLGLVEGVRLLPGRRVEGRLLSTRRDGAHLFLRYELTGTSTGSGHAEARAPLDRMP
jgi:riboflavin biosynthesis pyrimidine reductase